MAASFKIVSTKNVDSGIVEICTVPTCWFIEGEKKFYYPPPKHATVKRISSGKEPNTKWPVYSVENIHHVLDDYDKCKPLEEQLLQSSSASLIAPRRDEVHEKSDKDKEKSDKDKEKSHKDDEKSDKYDDESSDITSDTDKSDDTTHPTPENKRKRVKRFVVKPKRMKYLEEDIIDIKNRLFLIEKSNRSQQDDIKEIKNLVIDLARSSKRHMDFDSFPLECMDDFMQMEEKLKDVDYFESMKTYLTDFGGKSLKETVPVIMKAVLTPGIVRNKINFTGQNNKLTFCKSSIYKVIEKVLSEKHGKNEAADIPARISKWLRYTHDNCKEKNNEDA
ncbi:uncharacterized protein LOC135845627 [Planococcus citri]